MSFEADNIQQELTVKELLERILTELSIIRMQQEIITDQKIRPEEIDNVNR